MIGTPAASVITPVSIDHPEFLGSTVDKIAYEKAGILRKGAPVIVAPQEEAALRVIEGEAMRVGAPRIVADRDFFMRAEHGRLVFEDSARPARPASAPARGPASDSATPRAPSPPCA